MNNQAMIFERLEKNYVKSESIDWKLVVYLFFIMFSPPILPELNILIPVTIYSLISLFRNYQFTFFEVLKKSIVYTFIKLYILCYGIIFALIYLNTIVNGQFFLINFATNVYRLIILMGCLLICIIYFLVRAESLNYDFKDIYKTLLYALLLQVVLGLLAFFIPSVKSLFLAVMENNTGSDVFYREGLFSYGYTYRYNGFAGTLLDTFGYGTGLAAGITAILGFFKSKKYLIWSIILLIPSILNSRTGLLIAGLGFVVAFVFSLFKATPQKLLKQFAGMFLILLIVGLIFYITAVNSPSTVGWILDGFESIFDLLTGQEVRRYSIADNLFSDEFWTFPSNLSGLMFGEGFRVYGMADSIGFASDVGYINHIWLGGIVGTILMYIPFVYLFIAIFFSNRYNFSFAISFFLMLSFFAMLIKGDIIGYNAGMFINIFVALTLTYSYDNVDSITIETNEEGLL